MRNRRAFLFTLSLGAAGTASAQSTNRLSLDGPDSAKSAEELRKNFPFASRWTEAEFSNRKFLFALRIDGDGESYIDLHGWIYNRSFKEWRRVLNVATRNLGNAKILVDSAKGVLSLRGAANNELDGVEVLRFDLRATSDDSAYTK